MSAVAPDLPLLGRSLLALGLVIALLAGGRWILLRQGVGIVGPTRRGGGLAIAETLPLDARNRLVVIRRGEVELVLAVGLHGISPLQFPPELEESRPNGSARAP